MSCCLYWVILEERLSVRVLASAVDDWCLSVRVLASAVDDNKYNNNTITTTRVVQTCEQITTFLAVSLKPERTIFY